MQLCASENNKSNHYMWTWVAKQLQRNNKSRKQKYTKILRNTDQKQL